MIEDAFNMKRMRNTWAEINIDSIADNLREARRIIPANTKVAAVLKANAYGHGAVQTARALIDNNVDQLAVACLSEALELRRHFAEAGRGESIGYESDIEIEDKCIIGTLAVGYSDGYIRSLSDKAEVSIKGKRAPVIGTICMDQCMVDLANIPDAEIEDEVLLFGECGNDKIHLNELAIKANTNRNEILGNISRRVPRLYIKDSRIVEVVNYL